MTQITSVAPRLVLVLSNQIVRSSTIVYNLNLNWLLYSSETLKAILRRASDIMRRLHETHTAGIKWHMLSEIRRYLLPKAFIIITSNNQRLGSAGDNDRRSKRFCSNAVLCVSFTWQMFKTRVIRLRGVEGRNARDQIAFCAFHSFLVGVQTKCWLHTCDTCIMTTWRLGLRAPLVARNYYCYYYHCYWFILFIISSYSSYSLCLDNVPFRSRLPPNRARVI